MCSSPLSQPQPHQLARQPTKDNSDGPDVTSLRARLKALSTSQAAERKKTVVKQVQEQDGNPDQPLQTPEKPAFLGVTTAFFTGPMTVSKVPKASKALPPRNKAATTPQVPHGRAAACQPRTGGDRELQTRQQQPPQQPPQQPQHQQRAQSPPRGFHVADSSTAQDLIEAVAAQSNHLFNEGVTKLGELDHSLRSTQAETTAKDDQLLTMLSKSARKYCKPLSDSFICLDSVNENGVVSQKEVRVGQHVAQVKDRLETLDAEIASLWGQWEAAQHQVGVLFAEVANNDQDDASGESASTAAVKASLARQVAAFQKELQDILDDIHEEARASEKHFSKRIQAAQHQFLQDYLL